MRTQESIAASIGPFATLDREPRQVRKEATVAVDAGAEVRLVLAAIGFFGVNYPLVIASPRFFLRMLQSSLPLLGLLNLNALQPRMMGDLQQASDARELN